MQVHANPAFSVARVRSQRRGTTRAVAGASAEFLQSSASPSTSPSSPRTPPPPPTHRGVLILPGLGNNAADYGPLAVQLEARGMAVEVAQVTRPDWSRNAAALADPDWWKGCLKPRPAVNWYLDKVDAAMQRLKRRVEAAEAPITMLTHSAGGWLGRVYLYDWGTEGVDRFVSLGSPHLPPPRGAKGVDQTRGILTACNDMSPGAFHSSIQYVTICGKFVHGVPLTGKAATHTSNPPTANGNGPSSWLAKFAGLGYEQVCGEAEVWGDGIVPQPSAHLEGALSVDLEGVFHSPLGEKLPFLGPWYGSPEVLELWLHHLTGEAETQASAAASTAGTTARVAPA
ncbi:hypothetical protein VOLCADRAFT_107781 [Volvox carteri f. nagariensis]|uniref:GPI inositol-deacylase n=1 Tax=Volvox carteri f. nagariensis TaxID=3068 RepID=D8UGC2_VOLCA|nr:uncharacterized protein VOLCADRAFT_107781 [Volvox carteri f. nagariensis]EFJ41234.1 hypothetical protein VOLCADRAFT_107781 [Volvox carteri f. nagariensis]|eukprot:XP_002957685.1 hypothetical protein VOLCADRAFT_107781 [Volvox carteri f. nagariensis]